MLTAKWNFDIIWKSVDETQLNICDSGVVGTARPCPGRDRGFEPRLSLLPKKVLHLQYFFCGRSEEEPLTRGAGSSLRFASVGAKPTSTGRCAPVYRFIQRKGHPNGCPFSLNEPHPGLEVRASPLRSGPFKADIHRMS